MGAKSLSEDVSGRLSVLRKKIDRLDEKIVELLNIRAGNALEIGRIKGGVGLELYQPEREIAILERVRQANDGPLDAEAITRLFERIIDENRRLERLTESLKKQEKEETQD
jgi:chorismate mutase